MRTGRGPSLSEPWPVNLGSGRLILQIVILPFCRPYGEAHMAQQGSAISSIFPAHETERPPPGLSGSTQSRRTRVGGQQHPSGRKRRLGTVQKSSGRLGIRQEPPGCLAGQSLPAEGLAWQHRGVCRCACEPPIPRVLIKPLAPTSAAVVSAGSCRLLQCEGDNGTASCLIGCGSFPMTIRCPSDACFVLPLPCFHPSSNELHGSQDEPIAKDNRPRWRKLEFGQGLEGRLNRKSKKLDAPRFHARADVEPLGFSGQQFFSACLALAGARELRLSSAAVWTVLRGPMADRCRAVFALLVAWQGGSIRKPEFSTDGLVSCLVDWQLSVLADG